MLNIDDIIAGKHLAGARMIRMIEDEADGAFDLLRALYPYAGNAFIIGITGSPGVGKSTLVDALINAFRKTDKKVGVIAVDPTSPYSGGAILGDRVRMQQHATDNHVFIRSMASRGKKGGLSRATKNAAIVLDAMGFDIIIIETVGAGQAEFDIASIAHTVGIVSIPGSGDGIQAVKAGILETGDLFIVNKCDHPNADACVNQLESMLDMNQPRQPGWRPQVFKTVANRSKGVKAVAKGFVDHLDFMTENHLIEIKKNEQNSEYFKTLVLDFSLEKIDHAIARSTEYATGLENVIKKKTDPFTAAKNVVEKMCRFSTA